MDAGEILAAIHVRVCSDVIALPSGKSKGVAHLKEKTEKAQGMKKPIILRESMDSLKCVPRKN